MTEPLLRVRGLDVTVGGRRVVCGADFDIARGEVLGLVGPSGSGKSMTAAALLGLTPPTASVTGSIRLAGTELTGLPDAAFCRLRGSRLGFVPQDPLASLTPTRTVGSLLAEAVRIHTPVSRRAARERAVTLLHRVGLPEPRRLADAHPHELSGGMRQRVAVALAVANGPELLIADEPTSALDTAVGAHILDLFDELLAEHGTALLLVSHDPAVVARMCDRVLHVENGRIGPHRPPAAPAPAPRRAPRRPVHRPVLAVDGLTVVHRPPPGLRRRPPVVACRDVSLTVDEGEAVALVGPSGSGKTTILTQILELRPPVLGRIEVFGRDTATLTAPDRRAIRARMQAVFQDPADSLDPRLRVDRIIAEPLAVQGLPTPAERIAELLDAVGLPEEIARRHPRQLSGGQQQRVAIARALAPRPDLLVLDEPVSALDAPLRIEIMSLLDELRARYGLSYLMVSHDLPLTSRYADRVVELEPPGLDRPHPEHPHPERTADRKEAAPT